MMPETTFSHEYWMRQALQEAEKAWELGEVPIGAIIVQENKIIGKGCNLTEQLKDATAHAEIVAITAACNALESRYLTNTVIYSTLEPCPMCAGAIVLARIPTLVFGAFDPKAGACGTLYNITDDRRLNHNVHTISGVMDEHSGALLSQYFKEIRQTKAARSHE